MTGQYKPGDFVNITIERALVAESRFDDGLRIEYDGDAAELPLGPSITVELADPAGWPPEPGDLWRDHDGHVWLTCAVGDGETSVLTMICAAGAADRSHEQLRKRFGPLKLVHREGATDATG